MAEEESAFEHLKQPSYNMAMEVITIWKTARNITFRQIIHSRD
jgi:hypothetical protein